MCTRSPTDKGSRLGGEDQHSIDVWLGDVHLTVRDQRPIVGIEKKRPHPDLLGPRLVRGTHQAFDGFHVGADGGANPVHPTTVVQPQRKSFLARCPYWRDGLTNECRP